MFGKRQHVAAPSRFLRFRLALRLTLAAAAATTNNKPLLCEKRVSTMSLMITMIFFFIFPRICVVVQSARSSFLCFVFLLLFLLSPSLFFLFFFHPRDDFSAALNQHTNHEKVGPPNSRVESSLFLLPPNRESIKKLVPFQPPLMMFAPTHPSISTFFSPPFLGV